MSCWTRPPCGESSPFTLSPHLPDNPRDPAQHRSQNEVRTGRASLHLYSPYQCDGMSLKCTQCVHCLHVLPQERAAGSESSKAITIGEDVWVHFCSHRLSYSPVHFAVVYLSLAGGRFGCCLSRSQDRGQEHHWSRFDSLRHRIIFLLTVLVMIHSLTGSVVTRDIPSDVIAGLLL